MCDIKYGDVKDYNFVSIPWSQALGGLAEQYGVTHEEAMMGFGLILPWDSVHYSSVQIENKIKPKDMSYWFAGNNSLTNLDLSNIDTSNTQHMVFLFAGSTNLTNVNYGENFNKPSGSYGYMYGMTGNQKYTPCNRVAWSDRDTYKKYTNVVSRTDYIEIETVGSMGTLHIIRNVSGCSNYNGSITFYDANHNVTHTNNSSKDTYAGSFKYSYTNADKYFKFNDDSNMERNFMIWCCNLNGHDPYNTQYD